MEITRFLRAGKACVFVARDAPQPEKLAARLLSEYLEKMSGYAVALCQRRHEDDSSFVYLLVGQVAVCAVDKR